MSTTTLIAAAAIGIGAMFLINSQPTKKVIELNESHLNPQSPPPPVYHGRPVPTITSNMIPHHLVYGTQNSNRHIIPPVSFISRW